MENFPPQKREIPEFVPEGLSSDELIIWNEIKPLHKAYVRALGEGKFSTDQRKDINKYINIFADQFREDVEHPGYYLLWHFIAGSSFTSEMKDYKLDTEGHHLEIFLRRFYKKYGIK